MINWNLISGYNLQGGYRKGKIEKDFQSEIFKILRGNQYICFHPQDLGLANKFLDGHIIDKEGNLGWIEFKKINGYTFNVSQFEDGQVILLRELEKRNPDIARVFIYSSKVNKYKVFTFSELWNNKNERGGIKIFNS